MRDADYNAAMRLFAALGALLAWCALALQLYLLLAATPADGWALLNAAFSYLSFFTIMTNALVALVFTAAWLEWEGFFRRTPVQAAVVEYIVVVGIIYHLLLRQLWNPQGTQWVADVLLHSVLPIAYVFFWLVFAPREGLRWRDAVLWLIYPGFYLGFILLRGAMTGRYPYPFVDAKQLGYRVVMVHVAGLVLLFLAIGCVVIALGRMTQRQSRISLKT